LSVSDDASVTYADRRSVDSILSTIKSLSAYKLHTFKIQAAGKTAGSERESSREGGFLTE
jgi:hypothetical protein